MLRNKYLKNCTLSQISKKAGDSHFWSSLMGVKDQFLNLGRFKLVSGNQIRFWEDKWLGNQKLKNQFPNLFNIVRKKHITVAEVLSSNPLNVSFRRALVGVKLTEWYNLVASLIHINLNDGMNLFMWNLQKNGAFTVNSMYRHLVNNGLKVMQEIWHMKIPLKIKIFMWYLKRGVILTKDNLARRNWNGNKACCFCSKHETIQHLFVECHYAKFLWRAIHFVFGIPPPLNIEHLFNTWSKQGGQKHNILLLTGATAICWSI